MNRPYHLLKLSAKNADALRSIKEKYSIFFKQKKDLNPADIAYSANIGRTDFPHRAVVVGSSNEDFSESLTSQSTNWIAEGKPNRKKPKIGFLFSGQGAQYAGMGKALYESDLDFKQHVEQCSGQLEADFGFKLTDLLWGNRQQHLTETRYTQPAIYVLQTGIVNYLKRCGISPNAVLGHSVGEYAAAYCAGVISLEDGLTLIQARGQLMWDQCQPGGMLAVFDQPSSVKTFVEQNVDKVSFAAFNSDKNTVVAGDVTLLEQLNQDLTERGIKSVPLRVSHGFHSVQMAPMLEPFAERVAQVEFKKPRLEFYSTVTANKESEALLDHQYWVDHVKKPVNFKGGIQCLAASGIDAMIEIGPGATLTTLGQLNCSIENGLWASTQLADQEWPTLLQCLGELYIRGAAINWRGFDQPYERKRVNLPTYPFQRKKFWLDEDMLKIDLPKGADQGRTLEHLYQIQWLPQEVTKASKNFNQQKLLIVTEQLFQWQDFIDYATQQGMQITCVELSDKNEPGYWDGKNTQTISQLINDSGPFDHTLLLAPENGIDPTNQDNIFANFDNSNRSTLAMAKLLSAYVESEGKLAIGQAHIVTKAAQQINDQDLINPAHAILWGFGKTASLEYAHLWGGLKDLPAAPEQQDLALLLQAINDSASYEDQWATRSGKNYIARITPQEKVVGYKPKLDEKGSYLITGGLGGIGLTAAQYLVDRGAKHLVLMSRRGEATLADPTKQSLANTISGWREQKITVDIVAADLTNESSLTQALTAINQQNTEIKGIVHAAGVEQASLIHEMTAEHLEATTAAKTKGAWLLHNFADKYQDLEFFICCSSISGVWGSGALAAYSAGNLALDSLCQLRRSQGKPATSVSWGPWAEVGMATSEESQQLIASGLVPLPPTTAAYALFALAEHSVCHNIVVDANWSTFIPILEVRHPRPLFQQLKASQDSDVIDDQSGALLQEIKNLQPQEQLAYIRDLVRKDIADILGFDSAMELAVDSPLLEVGADSIQAVAIKASLESKLGKTLPTTLIFDYPTIEDIANFIASSLLGSSNTSANTQSFTSSPATSSNDIAIIGIACRLPGQSETPEKFWQLLIEGRDGVVDQPAERFPIDSFLSTDRGEQNKAYTLATGLVDGIENFDAGFFSISPREAKVLEPQQRMALECTWSALENAGLAPGSLNRSNTGVYFGAASNDYLTLCQGDKSLADATAHFATGNNLNVIGGRVSYNLGLMGPSVTLDTACSSSLVAVHTACQALLTQDCDMAIAGGTNAICTPFGHVMLCQSHMLSPTGRCHTFDSNADGYVRGEGTGVIVLKRLEDAERDGDNIQAVIKASAVNQDGRSSSLTAPNGPAQQAVIKKALAKAGLAPADIDYVETHGTGTALGDPIEINALDAVYASDNSRHQPLIIGAVKSNIGHLESASGIAGLIKLVLSLQNKTIPGNLHFQQWNPNIDVDKNRFVIPSEATAWPQLERPNRAAISSFGFSGTNAHIIVEQAPTDNADETTDIDNIADRPAHILTLSAKAPAALESLISSYCDSTQNNIDKPFADIAHSANCGRSHFGYRFAAVCDNSQVAAQTLANYQAGQTPETIYRGEVTSTPRIGFLFSGQGAQYAGMGKALYESDPDFKQHIEYCSELLHQKLGFSLESLLWGENQNLLQETRYTQPALYVLQTGLVGYLRRMGVTPEAVLGHSVGEFAAAYCAGVFSLEQGLELIQARGELMWDKCQRGAMLAVLDKPTAVADFVAQHSDKISIAAFNGPRNTVVAGDSELLEILAQQMADKNIKCVPLKVSHGFHSVQMQPMLAPFAEHVEQASLKAPRLGFYSTVTAAREAEALTQADYWVNHVQKPVNFTAAIQSLSNSGVDVLIEIGPGATLTTLGQLNCEISDGLWLNTQIAEQEWTTLLHSLAQLYVRGADISWQGFDQPYQHQRIALPTYPFQRKRYWPEVSLENHSVDIDDLSSIESMSDEELDRLLAESVSEI